MNSKSREELVEQYEDAAFELLMSEYAEQEGNRLLREFEEAKARGEVPEIPAALDAKCRRMIRKAYDKERRKERMHKAIKTMTRMAAVLFVTLGVCTTMVFSVEALRTPFVTFLIEQQEHFSAIDFDKESMGNADGQSSTKATEPNDEGNPLGELVPDGYVLSRHTVREDGSVVIIYKTAEGDSIFFSTTVFAGNLNFDTEDASAENVNIAGFDGTFVNKEGVLTMMWYDVEGDTAYQLRASSMNKTDFWKLAEAIAKTELGG